MYKKILILGFVYSALLVVGACVECKDVLSYYDFKGIEFSYLSGTSISTEDEFILEISENKIEYLAGFMGKFGIVSSCNATEKCPEPGDEGKKHQVTKLEIKSDSDWDGEHLAGTLLNDLVLYGERDLQKGIINYTRSLSEIEYFPEYNSGYYLKFPKPVTSATHILTIKLIKSNGDSVEATTESVTWLN